MAIFRLRLRALVALLALCCPSAAAAQGKEQFLRALVEFTNAVNGTHGDEGPALAAALDAMDAGLAQWDAAVARVEAGFAAQSGSAPPTVRARMHAALGAVYLDRGRLDEALTHLSTAATLDPLLADAHLLRGALHRAAGREDEAAAAYRLAWQAAPANAANAYLLLSSARGRVRENAAALAAMSAAVAASVGTPPAVEFPLFALLDDRALEAPVFVGAHYATAVDLLRAGSYREGVLRLRALAATDTLVADPALGTEAAMRVAAALRGDDAAAAVAAAEALAARHADSPEAHRLLGLALRAGRRHAESLDTLRKAVRLHAHDERARLAMADVFVASGDPLSARRTLEDASAALPGSGLALWKLARLQQSLGDEAAALRSWQAASRLAALGGSALTLGAIGRAHHNQLDLDAAADAYARRVAASPNSRDAHIDFGDVLRAQERLDDALVEYLAAALVDPASARALAMAGLVQASAGRDEEAVPLLRRAIATDPAQLEARYALSRALLRLGQADEAQRQLEVFRQLQARAMDEERQRFRDNHLKIDAALGAATERPAR